MGYIGGSAADDEALSMWLAIHAACRVFRARWGSQISMEGTRIERTRSDQRCRPWSGNASVPDLPRLQFLATVQDADRGLGRRRCRSLPDETGAYASLNVPARPPGQGA